APAPIRRTLVRRALRDHDPDGLHQPAVRLHPVLHQGHPAAAHRHGSGLPRNHPLLPPAGARTAGLRRPARRRHLPAAPDDGALTRNRPDHAGAAFNAINAINATLETTMSNTERSSRIAGFHRKAIAERIAAVADFAGLTDEERAHLAD